MRFRIFALSLSTLLVLCVPVVFAQRGGGYARRMPIYDPKTEITIQGTIEEVKQYAGRGSSSGTHLMLKTSEETIEVHVGPSWFLSQQQIEFAKGNEIEVTGSKVKLYGKDALLAREIKKDGKVITLRNAQGVPAWAGRRRP
jgi:hypothetical protein